MEKTILSHKKALSKGLIVRSELICSDAEHKGDLRHSYSISTALYRNGNEVDTVTVRDITSLENEAERIFSLVSKGGVTPMSLRDVICDLLSE